mmetsp:Transcript_32051/g.48031  ORF Transcript_32051/g.48031 Transcript_32051/m.48031 type:complete len:113 (-) Transcript_32051:1469-1807(-)
MISVEYNNNDANGGLLFNSSPTIIYFIAALEEIDTSNYFDRHHFAQRYAHDTDIFTHCITIIHHSLIDSSNRSIDTISEYIRASCQFISPSPATPQRSHGATACWSTSGRFL